MKADIALLQQDQTGLEHQVLREVEAVPDRIEVIDEPVDGVACIPVGPLRRGHRQQQVRVRKDHSAGIHADEDVQHLVQLLCLFQEEAD